MNAINTISSSNITLYKKISFENNQDAPWKTWT